MMQIPAVKQKSVDGEQAFVPEDPIPTSHKVRFTKGEFQAIPQDEEWPEDSSEKN